LPKIPTKSPIFTECCQRRAKKANESMSGGLHIAWKALTVL
jgi:hypothetical protein